MIIVFLWMSWLGNYSARLFCINRIYNHLRCVAPTVQHLLFVICHIMVYVWLVSCIFTLFFTIIAKSWSFALHIKYAISMFGSYKICISLHLTLLYNAARTRTWLFECSKQSICSARSRRSWAFDLEWVSDFYWLELLSVVDDNLMLTWKLTCRHGDGILISWFKGVYQLMSVWLVFFLCVFLSLWQQTKGSVSKI